MPSSSDYLLVLLLIFTLAMARFDNIFKFDFSKSRVLKFSLASPDSNVDKNNIEFYHTTRFRVSIDEKSVVVSQLLTMMQPSETAPIILAELETEATFLFENIGLVLEGDDKLSIHPYFRSMLSGLAASTN